jgi:hypothetical protein
MVYWIARLLGLKPAYAYRNSMPLRCPISDGWRVNPVQTLKARLVGGRATASWSRRPSFDLTIVTSSRPHDLSMPYFGVTLGSLVGQGVFTGTVGVSYNGPVERSGYGCTPPRAAALASSCLAHRSH